MIFSSQGTSTDGDVLRTLCDRLTAPLVVASPASDTVLAFKTDSSINDLGFNLTYSYSDCGGILRGPGPFSVASSPSGSNYGNNEDCAWLLDFEEGSQVKVLGHYCTFLFHS